LLLLAFFFVGCATQEGFRNKMNSFVGKPEGHLIQAYGVPNGSYQLADGSRVISYTKGGQVILPGATTTQPVTTNTQGNVSVYRPGQIAPATGAYTQQSTSYVTQQSPGTVVPLSCTVNFTISKDAIVLSWGSSGNHCVANP
jgi:hypothetical protein